MSLFSRRFWNSLTNHDRKLVVASTGFEQAAHRFRTSRRCMTQDAQIEFRVEFTEAVAELRGALYDLRRFQSEHRVRETT